MRCGLCDIEVKDWKIHTESLMHKRNLEKAANGEMGIASAMTANKLLARESMDRMDEAFNKLREEIKEDGKD